MNWWDQLIQLVAGLPNSIIDYLFNNAGQSLRNLIVQTILVDTWGLLQYFRDAVAKGDVVFGSTAVQQIYQVMKAVSYSFIALFFVMDVCKKAAYFETTTVESVVKPILMLIVGKVMVDNALWILQMLGEINTSMVQSVISLSGNMNSVMNYSGIQSTLNASSGVDLFFLCVLLLIFAVLMILGVLCMFVTLIIRQIELGILICLSPLFFSTLVADVTNDVFKSFLKNYVAVCFQTTVMAIACVIFFSSIGSFVSGSTGGLFAGFLETVNGIIGLAFFIFKSRGMLRESMGMGGGGGMSLASAIRIFF